MRERERGEKKEDIEEQERKKKKWVSGAKRETPARLEDALCGEPPCARQDAAACSCARGRGTAKGGPGRKPWSKGGKRKRNEKDEGKKKRERDASGWQRRARLLSSFSEQCVGRSGGGGDGVVSMRRREAAFERKREKTRANERRRKGPLTEFFSFLFRSSFRLLTSRKRAKRGMQKAPWKFERARGRGRAKAHLVFRTRERTNEKFSLALRGFVVRPLLKLGRRRCAVSRMTKRCGSDWVCPPASCAA